MTHRRFQPYRSTQEADGYFDQLLYVTDWTGASDADKLNALIMATKAVDALRFRGVKYAVWAAIVASGVDSTLPIDKLLAASRLTDDEIEAAEATQYHQFPRNGPLQAQSWHLYVPATGGTYTLTHNEQTTSPLNATATTTEIDSALEALTGESGHFTVVLDPDDVTAVEGAGPYVISHPSGNDILTATDIDLSGGSLPRLSFFTIQDNIPDDIFFATCEEARSILSGRDADQEFRNLVLTSDGAGSTRASMDRSGPPPDHSLNLITSPSAWRYLMPFLDDSVNFDIRRI